MITRRRSRGLGTGNWRGIRDDVSSPQFDHRRAFVMLSGSKRPFVVQNEHRAPSLSHASKSERLYACIQSLPLLRGLFLDRRACTLACDAQPQNGAPILIAVHGTWAAKAGWIRRDSKLLMELGRRWPDAGIYRFRWSGVNGARHRLIASDVLAEHLDHLACLYPLSKVVTISHSHGGNVVAWALTRIAHPLCAAIYLNTPFIQVLKRSKRSSPVLRVLLYFGVCVVLGPLEFMVPDLLFADRPGLYGISLGIGLGVIFAVLVLSQRLLPGRIQAVRERLVSVSNGDRKVSRELVAFVIGDEASAILSSVYFAQWLGRRAVILLIVAVFALAALAAFPGLMAQSKYDQLGPVLIGCCFAIYFILLLFATSAYGVVHGLVALDSSVTVTPAPVGCTEFATVTWTTRDRLRHSVIYESPDAIATIIKWLDGVLSPAKNFSS